MRTNCFIKFFLIGTVTLASFRLSAQKVDIPRTWKFKTGDDMRWAKADFDDSGWNTIKSGALWEDQGYDQYDGFAWYRTTIQIPSSLKQNAFLKDSLKFVLGKIDDSDQVYLNGTLVGQNAGYKSKDIKDVIVYDVERVYVIPANSPAIHWDQSNVLALRVWDHGGGGGMYEGDQYIAMVDIPDYIDIDMENATMKFPDQKKVEAGFNVKSLGKKRFDGKLHVQVKEPIHGNTLYDKTTMAQLGFNEPFHYDFTFTNAENSSILVTFTEKRSRKSVNASREVPYILTPPTPKTPKINGAKIVGVRPDSPFLFKIPATGEKPLNYDVIDLPKGLTVDHKTGNITGKMEREGNYKVMLVVSNQLGKAQSVFRILVGDQIALTPPMGWNSWNCWGLSVSDEKVRQSAAAMVKSGLVDHGWTYINIDDGWQKDHENGRIVTNDKFPDMQALGDYIHSLGLKFGIYSSPGPKTCGGFEGSYRYENADAQSYANWGIDYLKYDWCSYGQISPANPSLAELKKPYILMNDALKKNGRDIVFSLCQYGMGDVWKWGSEVGGNLWRTTGDIRDTWSSMYNIGFHQIEMASYAKPGNWNDPDMLIVGKVGWGPSLHNTRLTVNEQYTHISLWCLLSAPLLLGCDLSQLDDFTMNLLTNDEVLAVDQDPLGKQATPRITREDYQIWAKPMEDGTLAVGIFNTSAQMLNIQVPLLPLGITGKPLIHDLWRQKDLGRYGGNFEVIVPAHGVMLVSIKG